MLTRIRHYTLIDIRAGVRYLLEKAAQSEGVRTAAIRITQGKEDRIAAIYDWVKANVRYVPDEQRGYGDVELFISPVKMIKDYNAGIAIEGDCDDYSLLVVSLCRAAGIQANVVLLNTGGQDIDHAVAEVYSEELGKYIMLDPTATLPLGWQENHYEKIVV